jgi:hypothetical protein
VELLIKHGVDVNKRVIEEVYPSGQNRKKHESKTGKRNRTPPFFRRSENSQKQLNPQNTNPESRNFVFM